MKTVYADNAATTALCPEALDAMVDCLKNNYGNASSLHHMGQEAAAAVLQARRDIADAIGAEVSEIYFTSGWCISVPTAFEGEAWNMKTSILLAVSAY